MSDDGEQRYWVPRPHRPLWPEDRTEKFKELFASGLSHSKIALELGEGLTRNASIGKANRLGLHRAKPAPKNDAGLKPKGGSYYAAKRKQLLAAFAPPKEKKPYRKRRAEPREADAPESIEGAIGFFDLQPNICRFPVGEATGVNQLFCGRLKSLVVLGERSCSYCPGHMRKAYWCGPRLREAA